MKSSTHLDLWFDTRTLDDSVDHEEVRQGVWDSEYNGVIVPKVFFKKKYLKNNDKLEIVHFIGGG